MNLGDSISRYRITGRLGQGGMGVVYKAEDTRLKRPVALKFLAPELLQERDRLRLLNEAQAAAAIRHPNVCPIYDVEEENGQTFIVMAYLEGETLDRKIERGPLPIARAIDIAIQIAAGLEKAHELGIVHRDIKSGNILIDDAGHASILDFGLALRDGGDRLTAAGHTAGTPAYMSPEQLRGKEIDGRADVWALGVLLFEMVTGVLPFRRDDRAAVTHAIAYDEAPPVKSLRPDAPAALDQAIATALAKSPERRWQHAGEMAAALKQIPIASSAATETIQIPVAASSRKRFLAIAAALVCVVLSAAFAYYGRYRAARSTPVGFAQPASARKLVAVLPFQTPGAPESARTVPDGLMEVLTEALSELDSDLGKITPVPSSEILRLGITSVKEARRIYGVDLAITGSVQPQGGKLRCALQLVDAAGSLQIDALDFEYDPKNPTGSKNRAVEQVRRMLGLKTSADATRQAASPDSTNPGAYSPYLEGRGFLARYDVQGNLEKAIASFRRSVEVDPNFALAWAGLGQTYWRQARTGADEEAAVRAVESAERAIKISPGLGVAHSVLGTIYGDAGRTEDAIRELRKAIELAPGNAEAVRELARLYANTGRFPEAEDSFRKAIQSRPTDWYAYLLLGLFYQAHQRYQDAEGAYHSALQFAPGNEIVARNIGALYIQTGRYPEAVQVLEKSLSLHANARTSLSLGAAYFYQHRFQDAASAVEAAIELDSRRDEFWGNLGIYYKWIPGSEAKVGPALRHAIELAEKRLKITPGSYGTRASLAEYRARLGDRKGSLAEIARIPESARPPLASQLALAYELTGNRAKAIELIRSSLTNPATLNQIKDDPDLAGLWADPEFQKSIPQVTAR
jgi:serine/threonine-protein kinase